MSRLVGLIKEQVETGWRMSLKCLACSQQFPLSSCHHVTCKECKEAYCPDFVHICEKANAS